MQFNLDQWISETLKLKMNSVLKGYIQSYFEILQYLKIYVLCYHICIYCAIKQLINKHVFRNR